MCRDSVTPAWIVLRSELLIVGQAYITLLVPFHVDEKKNPAEVGGLMLALSRR